MGDYRKLIDDYVTTSTPTDNPSSPDLSPITPDEIYENPDEAVRRAVDSHPAILRAQELERLLQERTAATVKAEFTSKHPDFQQVIATPEFANWVNENAMRLELAQRANDMDMTAADALFSLYEAELKKAVAEAPVVEEVSLETAGATEVPAPDRYSRSYMLEQKIRAKQGDMKAESYVRSHAIAYRNALTQGQVRD